MRRLRIGVPQGPALAPLLFNIYFHDLPETVSAKYTYENDLAILHSEEQCNALEGILSQYVNTLTTYLQNWKRKLSKTKTVSAAFYLNNKEARRELSITTDGQFLPFCTEPK